MSMPTNQSDIILFDVLELFKTEDKNVYTTALKLLDRAIEETLEILRDDKKYQNFKNDFFNFLGDLSGQYECIPPGVHARLYTWLMNFIHEQKYDLRSLKTKVEGYKGDNEKLRIQLKKCEEENNLLKHESEKFAKDNEELRKQLKHCEEEYKLLKQQPEK